MAGAVEHAQHQPVEPWHDLASVAIARLAVLHRVGRGRPPDTLAGLVLGDEEVDALLVEVTGAGDAAAIAETAASVDPALEQARVRFAASLSDRSPFATLAGNASLDPAAAEVLAVAIAVERDRRLQRLVSYVQDDVTSRRLELATLAAVFGPEHPGPLALGPDAALRCAALVDVVEDGPWARHVVVVRSSVLWALEGDTSLDPELPPGATFIDGAPGGDAGAPLVLVSGPDRMRRREEAARQTYGARFLLSPVPPDDAGWPALVREATITGAGLIVELDDDLPAAGRRWVGRARHLPWALSSRKELPLRSLPDRPWVEFAAEAVDPSDEEWIAAFGDGIERRHHLSPDQVALVSRAYTARGGDFDGAVRRLVSGRLERLARRIRPTRGWDDIVVAPDRLALLNELTSRYRHADQVYGEWGFQAVPSRGLVALFSGPSGTGKTLAAEIVAGDLGLDVFKLDLSAVVSKYIGETEKNLEEVFDAAGAGNIVLFFDEADALFGKRSEVKDARDRYANIEVSYLLQRLEAYDGLVVLATNFERNIDDAFLRRIHTRIEFTLPNEPERKAIWDANLPPSAPLADVDTAFLAERFELSGGGIRNAAMRAAFAAAAAGTPITMMCLVQAVAREYQKAGRLVRPHEFAPYDVAAGDAPDTRPSR